MWFNKQCCVQIWSWIQTFFFFKLIVTFEIHYTRPNWPDFQTYSGPKGHEKALSIWSKLTLGFICQSMFRAKSRKGLNSLSRWKLLYLLWRLLVSDMVEEKRLCSCLLWISMKLEKYEQFEFCPNLKMGMVSIKPRCSLGKIKWNGLPVGHVYDSDSTEIWLKLALHQTQSMYGRPDDRNRADIKPIKWWCAHVFGYGCLWKSNYNKD